MSRAREHGIAVGEGTPGPLNAITDVSGVRVGHRTLIEGSGPLVPGRGQIRTGVTVVLPPGDAWREPVFAGAHRLNGNGEMTGLEWVRECGMLTSPVGLTNTHSVGIVREAIAAAAGGAVDHRHRRDRRAVAAPPVHAGWPSGRASAWAAPVRSASTPAETCSSVSQPATAA